MAFTFTVVRKQVRPNTGVQWWAETVDDDELKTFTDWQKENWIDTGYMELTSDVESADGLTRTSTRKFESRAAATAYLAESQVQTFLAKRKTHDDAVGIVRSKVSAKGTDGSRDKTSGF